MLVRFGDGTSHPDRQSRLPHAIEASQALLYCATECSGAVLQAAAASSVEDAVAAGADEASGDEEKNPEEDGAVQQRQDPPDRKDDSQHYGDDVHDLNVPTFGNGQAESGVVETHATEDANRFRDGAGAPARFTLQGALAVPALSPTLT